MVTRLYPGGGIVTGTQPSAALASWDVTTSVFRSLHQRWGSTDEAFSVSSGSVDPRSTVGRCFISVPLQNQTIPAGTVKGQFRCNEATTADDAQLAFALTIIKPDGTLRSVWLGVSANAENATTEMVAATLTNRKLRDSAGNVSIALSAIDVEGGDRIMLELGVKAYSTTNATINFSVRGTSPTSLADLAEDDTATSANTTGWIEFSQDIKFEQPFYIASNSVPTDDAAATNATATLTITPPTSMRAGDLVIVQCESRASATWSIGVDGGQAWTSETAFAGGSGPFCRVFWCTFNGTWGASPRFDSTNSTCTSAVMNVFRGRTTAEVWVQDVAAAATNHAAAASITQTGINLTANAKNRIAFVSWATSDDNTWSGTGTNPWDPIDWPQFRNTSGSDQSMHFMHGVWTGGGVEATGDVSGTEATNGNDACTTWIMAWRCQDITEHLLQIPTMERSPGPASGRRR